MEYSGALLLLRYIIIYMHVIYFSIQQVQTALTSIDHGIRLLIITVTCLCIEADPFKYKSNGRLPQFSIGTAPKHRHRWHG